MGGNRGLSRKGVGIAGEPGRVSVGEGGGEGYQAMDMEEGVDEAAPAAPAGSCCPMRGSWEH